MITFVLGMPRTGTTMTLGIVEELGITSKGDAEIRRNLASPRRFDLFIEKHREEDWSFKWHGFARPSIVIPILIKNGLRVIWTTRSMGSILDSFVEKNPKAKVLNGSTGRLERTKNKVIKTIGVLRKFGVPILEVSYDNIVDRPGNMVWKIAKFVDLEPKVSAVKLINPDLRHHVRPS